MSGATYEVKKVLEKISKGFTIYMGTAAIFVHDQENLIKHLFSPHETGLICSIQWLRKDDGELVDAWLYYKLTTSSQAHYKPRGSGELESIQTDKLLKHFNNDLCFDNFTTGRTMDVINHRRLKFRP